MEAMFLHDHPGWTWRDLNETPHEVVELLRMLGRASSKVAEARSKRG